MSNIDKIKKLTQHLKMVDDNEIERRRKQADNQPRDEHGRFIAIDPRGKHADENSPLPNEMNADDLFHDAKDLSMDDIDKILGLKKSEQHNDVVNQVVKQAASQIKEHGNIAKVKVPDNITGSFSAYKQHPHSKNAYALKYLIHRLENVQNYNTSDGAKASDKDFIKRREQNFDRAGYEKGDLQRLNQYNLPELHRIALHSHLFHGLLEHRDNLHNYLKQKQSNVKNALSSNQVIKNINNEPHVALFRGLDYGERKEDPLLASYSDTKQTLGDRIKVHHAHWVPLKNVWYSYNHGPFESHPNPRYPHQDEYLVSPHELQSAYQHEVKQIVPPKKIIQRKRASDIAVSFRKITLGRHPQSPAIKAKPAADPGKPPETPHTRSDTQSVVNFITEENKKTKQKSSDVIKKNGRILFPFSLLLKSFGKKQWGVINDNHSETSSLVSDHGGHFSNSKPADHEYIESSKSPKKTPEAVVPDGVSPKMLHNVNGNVYMTKPYHRDPEDWDSLRSPMHLMGWASLTNHNLYNSANIGHLCEDVQTHIHKGIPLLVHPFNKKARPLFTGSLSYPPLSEKKSPSKKSVLALQQIAVMDYLTHNVDRHSGNLMIMKETDTPMAIDHERSFQYSAPSDGRSPSDCLNNLLRHIVRFYGDDRVRKHFTSGSNLNPLRHWWNTNKDNLIEEFNKNIAHIKIPSAKKHITDNFMMRLGKMDNWAKNHSDKNLFSLHEESPQENENEVFSMDTDHIPMKNFAYDMDIHSRGLIEKKVPAQLPLATKKKQQMGGLP